MYKKIIYSKTNILLNRALQHFYKTHIAVQFGFNILTIWLFAEYFKTTLVVLVLTSKVFNSPLSQGQTNQEDRRFVD